MIEIVVKELFGFLLAAEIVILEQSEESARQSIKEGSFPKGMRFQSKISREKMYSFREKMVEAFLSKDYIPPEF